MSNPWDRPPFPTRGDTDDDMTYAGVGRVVTEWEQVELELGRLYSLFVDRHEQLEAEREYGTGSTFLPRLEKLKNAHEQFSQLIPDQGLEAEFVALIERIKKFSSLRNDVAHGIVRPIQWTIPSHAAERFRLESCLVPPTYKGKHFDQDNLPVYVYTYPEMLTIQGHFHGLAHQVIEFRLRLSRKLELKKRKQ